MKQTTKDWLNAAEDDLLAARYPGDLGLLPHGKPTISEANTFIEFCESLFYRLKDQIH